MPRVTRARESLGSILDVTIPVIWSSQRWGSKPSNFASLLVSLTLKTWEKISFSKQADWSFTTGLSVPKSSRNFRETGPRTWTIYLGHVTYHCTASLAKQVDTCVQNSKWPWTSLKFHDLKITFCSKKIQAQVEVEKIDRALSWTTLKEAISEQVRHLKSILN